MKSKISLFFLLAFSIPLYAQNDLKVISSDRNSILVEYSPVYSDTSIITIDDKQFTNVDLSGGVLANPSDWGNPAIQQRILNVGVPSETGNTIQIVSSSYSEIKGLISPIPQLVKDGKVNAFNYKVGSDYYNYKNASDLVSFGEYGISRGLRTQSLIISPVNFYPGQNKIRLYDKIVFKVTFSKNQKISAIPVDKFSSATVLNFNAAKFWNDLQSQKKFKKISNSVLSTGKWVKFEAPDEGIYKITRSMLASFGIDPNTVDPRTIKIYNNGGKILPEDPMASRPNDLVENAIIVAGQDDGKFDDGDYILFYGRGIDFWDYSASSNSVVRFHNVYSKENYYWITSGGANGKRITEQQSLNTTPDITETTTPAFGYMEDDKINIGKSGRQFFGDAFTQTSSSETYVLKLDDRVQSTPIYYSTRFANSSPGSIGLEIDESGNVLLNRTLPGYGFGDNVYSFGVGYVYNFSYSGNLQDNRSVLKYTMTPTSLSSTGYIDYYEIRYTRTLAALNDNIIFYSPDSSKNVQYNLNGFSSSNIQVFNVSDYSNVTLISNPVMLSGGEFRFQTKESNGNISKYIAVGNGAFKTPVNPVEVSNSNVHGIADGAKFIIITPTDFEDAANKLASFKETQARVKISTKVFNVDQIFNEFGCGMRDVSAIRDFIKYAYDNWTIKPEYVLLLGKGTYDYKDIEGLHNNFIPAYETEESLNEITSYATDDYFVRVDGNDNRIDLSIGRLTAENPQQANDVVDKIIRYESQSKQGSWRNLITLVADDGYTSKGWEGPDHTAASEYLANNYIPASFDLKKIYLAAYPVVVTGLGKRIPDAAKAIVDAANEGTLIMNYVGHGSPELWAHEFVFEKDVTIPQMHNTDYFFLTAATCDFGYFDVPSFQSSAELLVLKSDGGAIGALSSSRLVYSSDNHTLMYKYFQNLLQSNRDTLNLPITVGQAFYNIKQTLYSVNDQKYGIMCDPTLRLKMPEYTASIDSINGSNLTGNVDIKALSKTKIEGEVRKPDNSPWTDFSGSGILTMFDSQRQVSLTALRGYPMILQGGVIFRGQVSIVNGKFSTNFVVPKDISYENKNGKVIFYFFNNDVDGIGYTKNVIIGGTDSSTVNDGKGPDMQIFFDNTNFKDAYLVNPDSKLIVKLADQTGLNTTGTGVGHKLEGILNNDENNPIDFTNYFTGDKDAGGKSGEITYPFNGLDPGDYTIKVKAWDVFNNFSTTSANFNVVESGDLVIKDVYNYPNPFGSSTTFTFQQNLDSPLDVQIKIYTVAGRQIREIDKTGLLEKFVKINWDGRDEDGDIIANGTYLYKVIVKSQDGKFNKSVLGKLAVIR